MVKIEIIPKSIDVVLESLVHAQKSGYLFIGLLPPLDTTLELPKAVLEEHLAKNNLSDAEFRTAAELIGELIYACLSDSVEMAIDARLDHFQGRHKIDQQIIDGARTKLNELTATVKSAFCDERLSKRYDLKISSKAPAFTSVDWDTKVKMTDFKKGKVNFPYSTIRFKFQREFDSSPLSILGGNLFDSVQINFALDDIRYLSRVLNEVEGELEGLERFSREI